MLCGLPLSVVRGLLTTHGPLDVVGQVAGREPRHSGSDEAIPHRWLHDRVNSPVDVVASSIVRSLPLSVVRGLLTTHGPLDVAGQVAGRETGQGGVEVLLCYVSLSAVRDREPPVVRRPRPYSSYVPRRSAINVYECCSWSPFFRPAWSPPSLHLLRSSAGESLQSDVTAP